MVGSLLDWGLGAAPTARIWVRLVGSLFVVAVIRRLRQIDPKAIEDFEQDVKQRRTGNRRIPYGKWGLIALAIVAATIVALPSFT